MHPLCAHYRFMTLVKRKGGGCLLTCLTFKFRRHCCQVLCSIFCPMRDREGCVCVPSQRESRRDSLRVDESTRKLLTYSTRSVLLWCIVHQWKSSAGSATCLCVIKNNKTWGSRHCCIMQKERALGFALTICGRFAEASITKISTQNHVQVPHQLLHTHSTHSGKLEPFEKLFVISCL